MLDFIKELLNRFGEALSFADAGEMLTGVQKSKVLDRRKEPFRSIPDERHRSMPIATKEESTLDSIEHSI